jgi:hypothetical protein
MQKSLVGGLIGIGCILIGFACFGFPSEAAAQRNPGAENGTELITIATPATDRGQQITLIDPKLRVMSVYHVDAGTGALSLRSVRNITYDLQMLDYNVVGLKPEEIRSVLSVNPR